MTVAAGLAAGFLAARLLWLLMRPTFHEPVFARANHAGRPVPTAAGIVLPLALLLVEAARVLAGAFGIGADGTPSPERASVVVAALGLGLVGLLDDLAGTAESRGFRGHLRALGAGRLTTGGVKLSAGAAAATVAVAVATGGRGGQIVADALLVALAANLGNLLDRAPGRTTKVSLLAFATLVVAGGATSAIAGVAVVTGAAAALLRDDLAERLMLGDAGSNVAGGVLALGVVLACAPSTRLGVLCAVAVLNLAGEIVSFSRVIDAVPPLRAIDRAGRPRPAG